MTETKNTPHCNKTSANSFYRKQYIHKIKQLDV